jgi:hypothetical protein
MAVIRASLGWSTAIVMLALAWGGDASAHERSESFSHWRYQDGLLTVRFTVSAREATRIPAAGTRTGPGGILAGYLDGKIEVHDRHGRCRPDGTFRPVRTRPGYLQAIARWRCDGAPERLVLHAFFDLAAEHSHFATLEMRRETAQRLLTTAHRAWDIAAWSGPERRAEATFPGFVALGFRHITSGLDHMVFLLVLLIACRRFLEVLWAVSGFTLGHSLTLGLAAAGIIEPNLPAVEATIGLTIALVAVERLACNERYARATAMAGGAALVLLALASRWLGGLAPALLSALALFAFCYLLLARRAAGGGAFKILVTTMFGLIHGLGFATAFRASGAEPGQLLWPLAGFNVGVELGQLAIVGLMGAVAAALKTRPRIAAWSADLAATAGCAIGVYWFVLRGFS